MSSGYCHPVDRPFTIDIWSDVVCPYCYVGERQLERALAGFAHRDQALVRFHAFELNPQATISDLPLDELLAAKYGVPIEHARASHARLGAQAREYGLAWDIERARSTNTFDAHRLIALAQSQGRDVAMAARLHEAYFADGLLVSDHATLEDLAGEVGVEDAPTAWSDSRFADQVREDQAMAQELGLTGVPSVVIDAAYLVVGAQGETHFASVLERAWTRREGGVTPSPR